MHSPLNVKVHYIDIHLIVHYVLISCHCINLMSYLCIVFIKLLLLLLLLLFVFHCQDSFCTVPIVMLMTSSISTLMALCSAE
jgi:hypothetical protein